MSIKALKRVLAVTMAASLMVTPVIAGATDSSSSSSSESTVTTAEASAVETTSSVAAGGQVVKNELPGAFVVAKSSPVSGVAVRQTAGTIRQSAGLASNQTPFVKAYTVDSKKSPAVYASFNTAAAQVGGTVVGGLNVDLGALTNGKFSELPAGVSVPVTIGVKNFDANATYYIVKVLPGGAIEMVPCTVENGKITFNITGGLAGYGIIKA